MQHFEDFPVKFQWKMSRRQILTKTQRLWIMRLIVFALMVTKTLAGVAGLSKTLRSHYKLAWRTFGPQKGIIKSISHVKPLVVDHLCIDLNQIIHSCIRGSYKAPTISARIFAKLDTLLTEASPRESLVFAVDGTAPYAKVQTQRLRRKLEPDASMITPGTEFMNSMESVLLCYALQRTRRFNLQNVAVFISDSTCPGEGELKIIDWIRCHMPTGPSGVGPGIPAQTHQPLTPLTPDTVAICGSDADILVQGLAQQAKCPNIHVIQAGMDSTDAVCNITALLEQIATHPPTRHSVNETPFNTTAVSSSSSHNKNETHLKPLRASHIPYSARSDLVIRLCLAGNDYLPKLRGVPLLLDLHSGYIKQLPPNQRHMVDTANKTFNFVALWALMREADASTGDVLAPPVVIPSVVDALNDEERITRSGNKIKSINKAVSSAVQLAEWNWTTTLVPPDAVIRSYIHPDTGRIQYFLPPPEGYLQSINHTIYHLNESLAATGEHNMSVFKNNRSWVCSLQHQGHTYSSLRLRHIKPSARRHLADMVLQDWRQDAHGALKAKRNTALEALESMRLMAAEEKQARQRSLGLNTTLQVPALMEGRLITSRRKYARLADEESENSLNGTFEDDRSEDDEDVADGDNELLLNTGTVSRRSYLQYLRDSDIEHYLRGLLWVEHMYTQGRCSDLSYTYNGLPPISALAIQAYIERRALEHWHRQQAGSSSSNSTLNVNVPPIMEVVRSQQAALARDVMLPESGARPLTAGAAAVCVTPEEGVAYLPLNLRTSWKDINAQLSALVTHNNSDIICSTYDEVVATIEQSFAAHRQRNANESLAGASTTGSDQVIKPKDIWATGAKQAQRHGAGANSFGTLRSAQMPLAHNTWTVLANKKILRNRGYRGRYKHKELDLPLPIPFATFNLGAGASVFRLENHEADPSDEALQAYLPSDIAEELEARLKSRNWKQSENHHQQRQQQNKVHHHDRVASGATRRDACEATSSAASMKGNGEVKKGNEVKEEVRVTDIIHQDMLQGPHR